MPFKKEHIEGPKEFRQTVAIIKKILKNHPRTHLKKQRRRKMKRRYYGQEDWEYKIYPAGSDGVAYKGLSPFTKEKNPSFWIFQNKKGQGVFECFSSGKGGDVFQFIMEFKGLTFPEAVCFVLENSKGLGSRDPNQLKFNFKEKKPE